MQNTAFFDEKPAYAALLAAAVTTNRRPTHAQVTITSLINAS
jgi:hypothetical protein